MKKWRKKPIVIEAQQWFSGVEIESVFESDERSVAFAAANSEGVFETCAYVKTLEGNMLVKQGDYIVTGVEGEKYSVAKRIFEKTYDEIKGE